MKKNKKEKKQYKEVVLGTKIRDVKMNQREHFLLFVSTLILFNLLLLVSVWFVLRHLNNWYNWIICFGIIGLCFGLSLKAYRDVKHFNTCTLYDNAIEVKSVWFDFKVEYNDIREINVKETKLDKIFKLKTKSLEIKISNNRRSKFTIHFVEENALKLKHEITILVDKNSQNGTQENDEEDKKTSDN